MLAPVRPTKAPSCTRISAKTNTSRIQSRNISFQEYKRAEDNVLDVAKRTIRTPELKPDSDLSQAIFPPSFKSKLKDSYTYWEGALPKPVRFSNLAAFTKEIEAKFGVDISAPFLTVLKTPSDVAKGALVLQKVQPFVDTQPVEDPAQVRKSRGPADSDALGDYYDQHGIDIPWWKSGFKYEGKKPRALLQDWPFEEVVTKVTTALNQLPSKKGGDTPVITPETSFTELKEHFTVEDIRIAAVVGVPRTEFLDPDFRSDDQIGKYFNTFKNVRDLAAFVHHPGNYTWNLHNKNRPDFAANAEERIVQYYERLGGVSLK